MKSKSKSKPKGFPRTGLREEIPEAKPQAVIKGKSPGYAELPAKTNRVRNSRRDTIYAMLREGVPHREIINHGVKAFGYSKWQVQRLILKIVDEWRTSASEFDLQVERERHASRIEAELRMLKSARTVDRNGVEVPDHKKFDWHAISNLERLYGAIRGTTVQREETRNTTVIALAGVIAGLTREQEDEIVAKQLLLERKAAERDKLIIDSPVPTLQIVK